MMDPDTGKVSALIKRTSSSTGIGIELEETGRRRWTGGSEASVNTLVSVCSKGERRDSDSWFQAGGWFTLGCRPVSCNGLIYMPSPRIHD
jgi:hypothetical protein